MASVLKSSLIPMDSLSITKQTARSSDDRILWMWLIAKKDDRRGGHTGQTRIILQHKSSKALVELGFDRILWCPKSSEFDCRTTAK